MKISILTPTYNRGEDLKQLYDSLLRNSKSNINFEWLIMDDGSSDDTNKIVKDFINDKKIEIHYHHQKNGGKMSAINNLVPYVSGDICVTCDSDDYFTDDALEIIAEAYEKYKDKQIYALCFRKFVNTKISGEPFKSIETKMFDLYFKEGQTGEIAIVFIANIRKNFLYKLEHNEKFVTEARLYHEMDDEKNIICVDKPIMYCEYKENGYTTNILSQFTKSPYGYYMYFKEILQKDFSGVLFNKRIYAIKHYILFITLTHSKNNIKSIKNISNKLLFILLFIPGTIATKIKFK